VILVKEKTQQILIITEIPDYYPDLMGLDVAKILVNPSKPEIPIIFVMLRMKIHA
jgi:hypothetical protein